MNRKFSSPRGANDILPAQVVTWQYVEKVSRTLLHIYGYKEIRTPIFEETELFARSVGQTSDIVQKQMLNITPQKAPDLFLSKKDGLSLRPEGTASIVRSYIQNNLDKNEKLSKLFYIGPMFRGERPQKGRLRQFHQIGVEAIGPDSCSPYLDAEVIALSVDILNTLGLRGFKLQINSLGNIKDKEKFSKILREQLKKSINQLCIDCQRRYETNVFRILDCKNKECRSVINALNIKNTHLCKESSIYFENVCQALDILKIPYDISPKLVRGLDYYTHTVFEITDDSLGSQDALGAGGRYSNLVGQLGGPDVDAVGFALGMERILLAMPREKKGRAQPLDVFIIALDEESFICAFELLHKLRREGVVCDINYKISSMKSQMRLANKMKSNHVIILGETERQKGEVAVKNMKTGGQRAESLKNISGIVTIIMHT